MMRRHIMLLLVVPCLALAQGEAGLYRLMAGAVSGSYDIPRDGLMAEYLFTSDASDTSGNGDDFDNTTGVTFTNTASFGATSDLNMNSSNNLFEYGKESTISMWFIADSGNDQQLFQNQTSGDNRFNVTWNRGGDGQVRAGTASLIYTNSYYSATASADVWHHVAMVFDGYNVSLFIDNNLANETYAPYSDAGAQNLKLGNWGGTKFYFDGQMDNVRIYNRTLTTDEIDALYNEGHD